MKYDVTNLRLAKKGKERIEWAEKSMDVLRSIRKRFAKDKPLKGVRVSACLHITVETANLLRTLKDGGANVIACASNPLSTQDDTAAALVKYEKIPVFARTGENRKVYYRHLNAAIDHKPQITIDDGADLVSLLHNDRSKEAKGIWGSLEETTTGVIRLRSLEKSGKLQFPVVAVNDAKTKHFFDNQYGTGQSTLDGVIRATNMLLAGKTVVVVGYGWCGRGVANKARGMGSQVIVIEVEPVRALEATMDGFRVMGLKQAASLGDLFLTLTGDIHVLRPEHFRRMKDGAVVANSGHFDVEIDIPGLKKISKKVEQVKPLVKAYHLSAKRKIYILADGRLINLASAEGHPPSVMDMSFANQALAVEYIIKKKNILRKQVYSIPEEIDQMIAFMKLQTMGIEIDRLTPLQKKYLASWEFGT
ncbi:MAG: adenosylhomocysteinase [bacterium]